jgi:hypothetical protein
MLMTSSGCYESSRAIVAMVITVQPHAVGGITLLRLFSFGRDNRFNFNDVKNSLNFNSLKSYFRRDRSFGLKRRWGLSGTLGYEGALTTWNRVSDLFLDKN